MSTAYTSNGRLDLVYDFGTMRVTRALKWTISVALLALFGALATVLLVESLRWPIEHDGPMVLYPSYLAWSGQRIPYRQLFDVNFPGSFFLYGLLGWLSGLNDVVLQVFDAAFVLLLGVTVYKLLPSQQRIGGMIGFFVFVAYYFGLHSQFELQREFFLTLLLCGAVLLASAEVNKYQMLWVGMLTGFATTIKAPILLCFLWIVAIVLWEKRSERKRLALQFGIGLAIPILATIGYLVAVGALGDFLTMSRNYLPLYAMTDGWHRVMDRHTKTAYTIQNTLPVNWYSGQRWILIGTFLVNAAVLGITSENRRIFRIWLGLLPLLLILPAFAGQFFLYHFQPFMFFAFVGLGSFMSLPHMAPKTSSLVGSKREFRKWLFIAASALTVSFSAWTFYGFLPYAYYAATHPSNLVREGERVSVMSQYLRVHLRKGETVQPLDWTGGSLHAMQKARAPLATRFIYDFLFYQNVSNPYIQGLRTQFLTEFDRSRPQILLQVYAEDKPWMSGPDTTRSFPALERRLALRYHVVVNRPGYRIWERNENL
jgi:hypothetical protein